MQEWARRIAVALHIPEFKGSNEYIERFLGRTGVHKPICFFGCGSAALPLDHLQRTEKLRQVVAQYPLKTSTTWMNLDCSIELGRGNCTWFPSEDPRHARGTELQRHKARITIVLCINADDSHSVPVRYVGHATEPKCFRDNRLDEYKAHYSSKENAWMDSVQFNKWIHWWCTELRRENSDDILLIMDNCGGHATDISLPGLFIEMLLANSTSKYPPLDLGLIVHPKTRYRSLLLQKFVENTLHRASGEHNFPAHSHSGKFGLWYGEMPHFGDAMAP